MSIKMAMNTDAESIREAFISKKELFCVLHDAETGTRIEINREGNGHDETIVFRHCGETLAQYSQTDDQDAVLRLAEASPDTDLFLFWESVEKIYTQVPEIRDYLVEGLAHPVNEQLAMFDNGNDRTIFSIIMGVAGKEPTL